MTKTITLSIAAAIVIGSLAFLPRALTHASVRHAVFESSVTCGDQYNALVLGAKNALSRGDRAGAISGLIAAQNQLRRCEEIREREARQPDRVALNTLPGFAIAPVVASGHYHT